jgi:hypothetical protein
MAHTFRQRIFANPDIPVKLKQPAKVTHGADQGGWVLWRNFFLFFS